jgi:hypothetical protein
VAAVIDETPAAAFLYHPAPAGQVYLEIKATLKLAGDAAGPLTLNLGGPQADCWLVTRDGRVFTCLGHMLNRGPTTMPDFPADPDAKIVLDADHPRAELSLLFLALARLPQTRLQFSGSGFAELGGDLREPDPVISGRSMAGRWELIPDQDFQEIGSDQPVLLALSRADKDHPLVIERQAKAKKFRVRVEGFGAEGTLNPVGDDSATFAAAFGEGAQQVDASVRVFDAGRKLLIYAGGWDRLGLAYRRCR